MSKLRKYVQIGKDGEKLVGEEIDRIICELGYKKRFHSNCYLSLDSVYGNLSTEIDHIVFSPERIYIFEVKNCKYIDNNCDYDAEIWKRFNPEKSETEETCNPLTQNHNHKLILCDLLSIPLESVTTIEVLLINGKDYERQSPYANDYVLDKKQLFEDLRYLLVPSGNRISFDVDLAYSRFLKIVKIGDQNKPIHIRNLNRINLLKNQMKKKDLFLFKHTDVMRCPNCNGGILSFEQCSWELLWKNNRASQQLYMKCSKCDHIRPYDRTSIKEIKTIGIIERNEWLKEETHMNTAYDREMNYRARIQDLETDLKIAEKMIFSMAMELNESHEENQKQSVVIQLQSDIMADLNSEVEKGKLTSTCLKRLCHNLARQAKNLCVYLVKSLIKIFKALWRLIITSITQ